MLNPFYAAQLALHILDTFVLPAGSSLQWLIEFACKLDFKDTTTVNKIQCIQYSNISNSEKLKKVKKIIKKAMEQQKMGHFELYSTVLKCRIKLRRRLFCLTADNPVPSMSLC